MVMQTNTRTAFSLSKSDKTVWDHMLQNTSEHSNGFHEQGEPAQKRCAVAHSSLLPVHIVLQHTEFVLWFLHCSDFTSILPSDSPRIRKI